MRKGMLLIFIALALSSFAVPNDIWEVLAKLRLKVYYNAETELFCNEIIPTKEIKNLDGKEIIIKGFVVQNGENNFILSKYPKPFNYCGGSVVESIMTIKTKHEISANIGKICTLKGQFELNTTDVFELPYILNQAECLDCE